MLTAMGRHTIMAGMVAADRRHPPRHPSQEGLGRWHFAILLSAALSVSMAYGVTLPLLPDLLASRIAGGAFADVARHTGWITGIYTLALFLCSPAWGALSDVIDRRWVTVIGLTGSGIALWLTEHSPSLLTLYINRILAGMLSAAVLPAVFACVVEGSAPSQRPIRFAWITAATALGFFLGPVVGEQGNALSTLSNRMAGAGTVLSSPFMLIGLMGVISAAFVLLLPGWLGGRRDANGASAQAPDIRILPELFMVALAVLGITIAEVGLTLLGQGVLPLGTQQIAIYFAFCSIAMLLAQIYVHPFLERRFGRNPTLGLSFAGMAAGVALLPWPVASWTPAVAFLLSGGGIGVLLPALSLRIATMATNHQGWAMGRLAAAANLGQAVGAAMTGALYVRSTYLPFIIGSVALLFGATLSRQHLARRDRGDRP